ncbi:MAG: hypothetical protein LBV38_02060 [Alistipes sp.]|jgi:hypothetical protein|nr:hypothetical protein [Alistipes sp.]
MNAATSTSRSKIGRKTGLILLFYRSFAIPSNLLTGVCAGLIVRQGAALLFPAILLKLATLGIVWFAMRESGNRTLCYFTNRGLSPLTLWTVAIAIDLTFFAVCVTIATLINLS